MILEELILPSSKIDFKGEILTLSLIIDFRRASSRRATREQPEFSDLNEDCER